MKTEVVKTALKPAVIDGEGLLAGYKKQVEISPRSDVARAQKVGDKSLEDTNAARLLFIERHVPLMRPTTLENSSAFAPSPQC